MSLVLLDMLIEAGVAVRFDTLATYPETDESNRVVGMTAETMTDDVAFISGATMTMNAVKTATHDVFDAFATLKENGGLGNE